MTEVTRSTAQVELRNRQGLHARPAHLFVQIANAYAATLRVRREGGDEVVDGKSIMGMMMLAAEKGAVLVLEAEGADAHAQIRALVELIETGFDED